MGACYLAEDEVGAVLEALAAHLTNLPIDELRVRAMAHVDPPDGAPPSADLTDPALAGLGITAALWAGADRPRTQT